MFRMRVPAVIVVAALLIYRAAFSAGDEFARTVANNVSPPGKAPEGMIWIPGGEFSMGAAADGGGSCEMPMAPNDAGPIHRAPAHGSWIDGTALTNEQLGQ